MRITTVLFAFLVLSLAAAPASADKVTTKTGDTFTGTIIEEDAAKVVLKTVSGTMTIPRETIKSVEKAGKPPEKPATGETPKPAAPTAIVAVPVEPANAGKALADAKTALAAGDWIKAGGLLEGLMALDEKAFPAESRLAATGALITCQLQIKDAAGAARAMARRASVATDASDKRRLMAAAEMLRSLATPEIGGKALSRFEEVVEAAMPWKAAQLLAEAKDLAGKNQRLNEMPQLEKAAKGVLARLDDADVYVPGYCAAHKAEALGVFVTTILGAAKQVIDFCDKERPELTRTRFTSIASRATAKVWNDRASVYLTQRQVAEDALKNVKPFTAKFEAPDLYTTNAADIAAILAQLDEYRYYPAGTALHPPGYYGYYYSTPPTTERILIKLRTF